MTNSVTRPCFTTQQQTYKTKTVLPARRSKRGLCYGDLVGWLGVCLSVTAGIVSKRLNSDPVDSHALIPQVPCIPGIVVTDIYCHPWAVDHTSRAVCRPSATNLHRQPSFTDPSKYVRMDRPGWLVT